MPSTYSNLKIQLMATGENNTTWGDVTNVNLGTALEEAIVGSADVAFSNANVTLTLTDTNSTQSARNMRLNLTGTATTGYNLVVPAIEKPYIVNNGTDGTITVKNTTGTGIAVPAGKTMWLFNNGTNVVDVVTHLSSVTLGSALPVASGGTGATTLTGVVKGNGTSAFTAGTVSLTSEVSGTLPVANGGTGVTTSTGTTSVVLSNSPVLVTPTLGAASATSIANGLGAVGTPSYTFTGDLNTGMWSPAADTIAFSEGGVEAMRITSAGDVGIGTSSPGTKFEVSSSSFNVVASRSTTSFAAFQRFAPAGQFAYDFYTINAVEAARITVTDANIMAFATGSAATERMRIDSSGNVGIGTSSPGFKLDVNGTGYFNSSVQFFSQDGFRFTSASAVSAMRFGSAAVGESTAEWAYDRAAAATTLSVGSTGSALTERMRIDSSGNVGIGTSSPDANAKLDVAGTVRSGAGGSDPGTGGVMYIVGSGSFQTVIGGAAFAVHTGANNARTERMRIDSSGNVGIGTSSPTYRLDIVSGDTTASVGYAMRLRSNATATAASLQFTNSAASAQNGLIRCTDTGETVIQADGASSLLAFRTNGSERMRIDSSGNVGIGTTSISYKLEVAGDVRIAGGGGDLRIQSATGTTSTGGDSQIYNDANNMIFTTGTTTAERMRIGSSGDVGIGTSSPSSRLEVNASSGSTQVAYFINNSAGSTLAGIVASIESGGNNTNSFHFAGVTQTVALWYLYGNGTTSYTSDIRVKKNVTTTRDGYLEDVCKLRVVKYNWYNDSDETPRELGFIAQEVEQVFPGLVQDALHPTKDGEIHKVLKGSVMMPIMLKALQEASAKIDALTARVAQLEGN